MIPVCEPTLSGREAEYAADCLRANWISSGGKFIGLFEEAFAGFCGAKYCVSCSSGTAALHLALAALDIGPGDEVIIPSFAMIAVGNAVIYTGATPVLVESKRDTWTMDPEQAAAAVNGRTRAIIAMHTYGHPVDMDPLLEIAAGGKIAMIEDSAEAHGAEYKGRRCGSIGLMSAFSFYGNKILTTGEGGAVTTSDTALAARLRSLENHCFGEPRFVHEDVGFNYRMTNIEAAIGLAQVEAGGKLVEMRRQNAAGYNRLLAGVPGVETPPEAPWAKSSYWMYGVVLGPEFPLGRDEAMAELRRRGIDTRAFFHPLHLQPAYSRLKAGRPIAAGAMPVAEELGACGLYLPSSSHLEDEQIRKVADAIFEIASG